MSQAAPDAARSRTGNRMADDHSQRPYRSTETIARSGQARSTSTATGTDPLAELARLIGQTDPFGDLGKEPRRAAPAEPVDWAAPPPQSFAPHQPAPPVAPHFAHEEAPRYGQPYAQPAAADLYQVEQEVPAYLTQQRSPGYDQNYLPHGEHEDVYDDLPPARRRIGVLAIAGIFALVIIGTAGAFGYRSVFGGSGAHMPPPVIKADTAPSKIVPDNAGKDSSKLITERVGGGADEKIVSREERPVDIKDKIATPVFPPVTGTAGIAGQTAQAGNGVIGGEPRKVHTITIRPDRPMVADAAPAASMSQQPSPIAMPEPQPIRAAAPPLAPAKPQQRAAAPEPASRPIQTASRAPAPPPARASNAPLSLNPEAAPAPAPRAPVRTASTGPTSLAPTPSANAASAARGGYAVQVTSQRSEGEAQSAYQSLKGKYGSVLGSRSMFVHKVELGAKGTYYRAMVGPFASQAEASQVCSSLKSAGGSCLVQRN
jgi:sporulation related protein